jgi:hypothetical protein
MIKKRIAFLETSPDKSQPSAGDGSSNTDSPTPTGRRIAAILKPKTDSSLPMESLSDFHKEEVSVWETANGSTTATDMLTVKLSVGNYLEKLFSLKT